ncbi:uncharacterized protein [Mycetomoellerius zeteki]|nr:PREDICTED: uncharacterized protein LOC108728890 [Trachymyrmex zeteki]XP_018313196.1 PREDICTED: uncharacterized protein LOC108728890 [Trachymyrmex zeteki]
MQQLVSALALVGLTLVTALPQEKGSLADLIDQAFPQNTTTPQGVPAIGGDVDSIIKDIFSNVTTTTASSNVILGITNQTPKPDDCECVPYYQCKEGKILDNGIGIIDIRSDFGDKDEKPSGTPLYYSRRMRLSLDNEIPLDNVYRFHSKHNFT